MKLRTILFGAALVAGVQTNAQTWVEDSVEMGASYANDVFYDLATGTKTAVDASNWHLAFQMTTFGESTFTATVRANHIKGKVEVYSLHLSAAASFNSLTAADTVGKTDPSMQMVNVDSTYWGDGAFTQYADPSNQFDFGWGIYQGPPDHNLLGDSVYLVKVNGVAYKLWLQEYISMGGNSAVGYKFDIGILDGSSPVVSQYITRANYTDRLFAYYDITTNTVLDREPGRGAWNLLFTQYPKPMVFGPVDLQAYAGVFSNDTLEIAEVQNTDPNTINSSNYMASFTNVSTGLNVIGDDWKYFPGAFPYVVDTMKSWIIKTPTDYYQLGFTRFDGGTTGKSVFRTRKLGGTTTVQNAKASAQVLNIFPNPAANDINIVFETNDRAENTQLVLTDMTGKTVYQSNVNVNKGLNAIHVSTANFANGNYILTITNGKWNATQKFVVQH